MPDPFLVILYLCVMIVTFLFMEGVAWFLHKYVRYGVGWYLHEDHHRYTGRKFQKNDVFGLFFTVHDIFFHRRIKIKCPPKSKYIKHVLHAHAIHHQQSAVRKGLCFGFLYARKKYALPVQNPVSR